MLVVDGEGLLQRAGSRIEPLQAGDVVWMERVDERTYRAA